MTKSNNEWVPEIGQVVMGSWVNDKGTLMDAAVEVVARYKDKVWIACCGLDEVFHLSKITFRPIKTEAEKLRDEQIAFMNEVCCEFHRKREIGLSIGEALYKADCRITRPMTYEAIDHLIIRHQDECETLSTHEFARMVEKYIRGELNP